MGDHGVAIIALPDSETAHPLASGGGGLLLELTIFLLLLTRIHDGILVGVRASLGIFLQLIVCSRVIAFILCTSRRCVQLSSLRFPTKRAIDLHRSTLAPFEVNIKLQSISNLAHVSLLALLHRIPWVMNWH
jgi:hypothetical protein